MKYTVKRLCTNLSCLKKFSHKNSVNNHKKDLWSSSLWTYLTEIHSEPCQTSNMEFHKTLHLKCLTGFWICLCLSSWVHDFQVVLGLLWYCTNLSIWIWENHCIPFISKMQVVYVNLLFVFLSLQRCTLFMTICFLCSFHFEDAKCLCYIILHSSFGQS